MVQNPTNTADLDTTAPVNFFERLSELPWVVPLVELHASSKKKSTLYRTGSSLLFGSWWMITSGFRVYPLNKPVSALDSTACKLLQSVVNKCPSLEKPPHVVFRNVRTESEIKVYRITSKLASFRISQALLRKAGDTVYTLEKILKEPHDIEALGGTVPGKTSASAVQRIINTARQAINGVRRKSSFITAPVAKNLRSIRRRLRTTRIAGLRHSAIEMKIQRRRKLTPKKRLPESSATRSFAAGLLTFFLRPLGFSFAQNHPPMLEMEEPLPNENSPSKLESSPREKRKLVETEDESEDESRWWEELEAEGYDSEEDPDYEPLATSFQSSEDTQSDICEDVSPQSLVDTSVTEDEDDELADGQKDERLPKVTETEDDEKSSTALSESAELAQHSSSPKRSSTTFSEPEEDAQHFSPKRSSTSVCDSEEVAQNGSSPKRSSTTRVSESEEVAQPSSSPIISESETVQECASPTLTESTLGDEFHSPPQTEKSLSQFTTPVKEVPTNEEFHSPEN